MEIFIPYGVQKFTVIFSVVKEEQVSAGLVILDRGLPGANPVLSLSSLV